MDLRPPRIDFLLPHATWDHPPARRPATDTEYAEWLIAIFDRWLAEGARRGSGPSIRSCPPCGAGRAIPRPWAWTRRSRGHRDRRQLRAGGLAEGGVRRRPGNRERTFSAIPSIPSPPIRASRPASREPAGCAQTCRECPVVASCGGGLYPHRYRSGNGFDNPSVYCTDLLELISHISSRLPAGPAGGPDITAHTLGAASFRALAGGFGDAADLAQLAGAEHSLVRGLLSAVYQAGSAAPDVPRDAKAALRGAWSLLAALDRDEPATLNAVLSHPYIRAWALRCLERLSPAGAGAGEDEQASDPQRLTADLGHLAAIAAAAAVRAGAGAAVTVPVLDGAVHLPTLGRLALGTGRDGGTLRGIRDGRGQRDQQCRDHPGGRSVLDTGPA